MKIRKKLIRNRAPVKEKQVYFFLFMQLVFHNFIPLFKCCHFCISHFCFLGTPNVLLRLFYYKASCIKDQQSMVCKKRFWGARIHLFFFLFQSWLATDVRFDFHALFKKLKTCTFEILPQLQLPQITCHFRMHFCTFPSAKNT